MMVREEKVRKGDRQRERDREIEKKGEREVDWLILFRHNKNVYKQKKNLRD